MEDQVVGLMAQLRKRPGKGGVRLSYEQADLTLRIIESGARYAAENARLRELLARAEGRT